MALLLVYRTFRTLCDSTFHTLYYLPACTVLYVHIPCASSLVYNNNYDNSLSLSSGNAGLEPESNQAFPTILKHFTSLCVNFVQCCRLCALFLTLQPAVFGGFTRQSSSSEPETTDEPEDPGLTNAPPPAYNAAANFPSVTSKPQDLPPPYTGPTVGFVYSPTVDEIASTPPPALGYPSYPPEMSNQDRAYPPPTAPPSSVDPAYLPPAAVSQELPYPVNLEPGGGAYPHPLYKLTLSAFICFSFVLLWRVCFYTMSFIACVMQLCVGGRSVGIRWTAN